jgi:putative ABC transport system substrate-binding protein
VELVIRKVAGYSEISAAVTELKAAGVVGLNVLGSAMLFGNRRVIFERTSALQLPAIYQWPENAAEGGLIGYGPSIVGIYGNLLSHMAAGILRGASPANMPVEQPTRFYLTINLKTANALNLALPKSLLVRADEVIE